VTYDSIDPPTDEALLDLGNRVRAAQADLHQARNARAQADAEASALRSINSEASKVALATMQRALGRRPSESA
jgi:hypothetical protein